MLTCPWVRPSGSRNSSCASGYCTWPFRMGRCNASAASKRARSAASRPPCCRAASERLLISAFSSASVRMRRSVRAALFNAGLFGSRGAVDGHIVSHIARLRRGTIPGPLLPVHSPGEALRPGFAGSGGGGGQDAVFPAFRSLQSAFGDPPSGLHLIEGFPGRVGVAPETLPHNVGDGDNAVMTDIGDGGILALGDGVLLL